MGPSLAGKRSKTGQTYNLYFRFVFSQLNLRTLFILFLSPLPPGSPGGPEEGPDCYLLREIDDFGADFGPDLGGYFVLLFCLT